MKKLIALMLVVSFTGAVIAQQNVPQSSVQAKPAVKAPANNEPSKNDKEKDKKKHHHHHSHLDKPGEGKK
jgi:hypothetical protein